MSNETAARHRTAARTPNRSRGGHNDADYVDSLRHGAEVAS